MVQKTSHSLLLMLLFAVPHYLVCAEDLAVKSPEVLIESVEKSYPFREVNLKSQLHIGYCYSAYRNDLEDAEDHVHGENGEVVPVETTPDQSEMSVQLEPTLLWINAEDSSNYQAKASFGGDVPFAELVKTKESFDYLDQLAGILDLSKVSFHPDQSASSWSFINNKSQVVTINENMMLLFEFVIVNQDANENLVAKKLHIYRALSGGEDFLQVAGYCHYPKKIAFEYRADQPVL